MSKDKLVYSARGDVIEAKKPVVVNRYRGFTRANHWLTAACMIVLILSGYHGWLSAYAKKLARGERPVDGRKLRMLNEVPGIAAAIIVILVVVKPF